MTAEERRIAAKRYVEEDSKVGTGGGQKRRRLMKVCLDWQPDCHARLAFGAFLACMLYDYLGEAWQRAAVYSKTCPADTNM